MEMNDIKDLLKYYNDEICEADYKIRKQIDDYEEYYDCMFWNNLYCDDFDYRELCSNLLTKVHCMDSKACNIAEYYGLDYYDSYLEREIMTLDELYDYYSEEDSDSKKYYILHLNLLDLLWDLEDRERELNLKELEDKLLND